MQYRIDKLSLQNCANVKSGSGARRGASGNFYIFNDIRKSFYIFYLRRHSSLPAGISQKSAIAVIWARLAVSTVISTERSLANKGKMRTLKAL